MGGADTIEGGKGNDKLFGTDEYQSGLADGSQTSVDGKDVIKGESGEDTIVGASRADELRGGEDADTIIEGPANDQAVDTIVAGGGNDNISSVSMPAARDIVDCGDGNDEVQADSFDQVAASCEKVDVVDPEPASPNEGSSVSAQTADEQSFVSSTENTPPDSRIDEEGEPQEPTPPPTSGEVSAQRVYGFRCWAPPVYRGDNWCFRIEDPNVSDLAWVGIRETIPVRWIRFNMYTPEDGYFRYRLVHQNYDPWDWIFYGAGSNDYLDVKARTSCWSNCLWGTYITFGQYEIRRYWP